MVAPSSCSEKSRTAEGCRWLGVLRGEDHSAVDRLLLSPGLLSAGSSRLAGRLLARHASLIVGAVVAAVLGVLLLTTCGPPRPTDAFIVCKRLRQTTPSACSFSAALIGHRLLARLPLAGRHPTHTHIHTHTHTHTRQGARSLAALHSSSTRRGATG